MEGKFWLEIRKLVLEEAEFGLEICKYGVVGCVCRLEELGDGGFFGEGEIKYGRDGEIGKGEMGDA